MTPPASSSASGGSDVAVVGAGPVGLATAALLAARGVPSTVLDARAGPVDEPRAVHLDDEAQRILAAAGALGGLPVHPMTSYELRDADGRLLHSFPRTAERLGHPPSVLFHQPDLVRALLAVVEASGLVEVRWGHEVLGVSIAAPGAVLDVRAPEGTRAPLRATTVLACDGASSAVRRLLGMPSTDLGFAQSWLVVDLRVAGRPPALRHPQQRCDPLRPSTSVPVGPARHRLEMMLLPGETAADVADRLPQLLGSFGFDGGAVEVERQAVYRFRGVVADEWRRGPVLLAGDAAHQMPPFFGQGLCSGLRDAANLAWKVALVQRGIAVPALLDTYGAERRPQVAETIRRTALLGRFVSARGTGAATARRAAAATLRTLHPLRRAIEGIEPPPLPPGDLVVRRRGPGVTGRPFPQPLLRTPAGSRPADEVLGDGFALIGWEADPLAAASPGCAAFWTALGARRLRLGPDDAPSLGPWFARARGRIAVVRPDRTVLGVARMGDADGLDGLTRRVARYVA